MLLGEVWAVWQVFLCESKSTPSKQQAGVAYGLLEKGKSKIFFNLFCHSIKMYLLCTLKRY